MGGEGGWAARGGILFRVSISPRSARHSTRQA